MRKYVIDACSLINAAKNYNMAKKAFIQIWETFDKMVVAGTLLSSIEVLEELKARDEQDMNRPVEPLRQAPDAELVDSTSLTFDETVEVIVRIAEAKRHG